MTTLDPFNLQLCHILLEIFAVLVPLGVNEVATGWCFRGRSSYFAYFGCNYSLMLNYFKFITNSFPVMLRPIVGYVG